MPKIRQNINPYQGSIEAIIRPNWDGNDGEMHNIFHVDAEDTTCVLHLKFDEGSGSTAYDSSIYGNNGTISGATWSSGIVGSGLSFDGVDDYVSIAKSNELDEMSEISILAWVKMSLLKSEGIIRHGVGSSSGGGYNLHIYNTGQPTFWVYDASGNISNLPFPGILLNINTTYFLSAICDGTSQFDYYNGELNTSKTINGFTSSYGNPIFVGAINIADVFDGIIDEPTIFNRALSASEIKAIYENGRTGIGLAKGKDNYLGFLVPGVGVSYDVSTWTAGNTYHVVGSWDKENAYLYINGSLVASGTRDTSAVVASVDNDIYVGNILGTVTADSYVHTRVYDVVLPATQTLAATQGLPKWMSVEGLYNSGDPIDAPVTEHVLFKYPTS